MIISPNQALGKSPIAPESFIGITETLAKNLEECRACLTALLERARGTVPTQEVEKPIGGEDLLARLRALRTIAVQLIKLSSEVDQLIGAP